MTSDLGIAAVAETHISWVVLLGDRAFKIKKPVSLPFLDFSTPERRLEVCEAEVTLNRRFAPDVYEGVLHLVDDLGRPVDHVVAMRRMPDDRRLSHLVRTGAATQEDLADIARRVAEVHAAAAPVGQESTDDTHHGLRQLWRDGFEVLDDIPGIGATTLHRIHELCETYIEGRRPLFEARRREGWHRDGHGDLLADDIFLLPDGPRILDCLEFDKALRIGDVLLDVAFLAMDLERLGDARLARVFVERWASYLGEEHPPSLLHHFIAYRAFVRAKVMAIRHSQGDDSAAPDLAVLLALVQRHLEAGRVVMVLIGGLPGSGKSTISDHLEGRQGMAVLRSDETRKELAGLSPADAAGGPIDRGIYSARSTDRTYRELLDRAMSLTARGCSVVLDASWSSQWHRDQARAAARFSHADLVEIECVAPHPVLLDRLRARERTFSSDATWEVAAKLADRWALWPSATQVRTDRPLGETVDDVVALLPSE